MTTARTGNRNASKKWTDPGPPPWASWSEANRAARAIRWIETFCVPPKGHGAGEPMRLADFQKRWLEEVLSDGVTSACMSLGRGNGKSTLLAALAVWALMDPDEGGAPQVPIVATTVQQAVRSVYGVALEMIAKNSFLADRALVYSAIGGQKVKAPQNGGELFPVSSDPDGLQGLDPSLAICDEVGFLPVESWSSLLLASGKRPKSLVVGIGTPGFDKSSALWQMRQRWKSGDRIPGFIFTEYAADENCRIDDQTQWHRANPALAEGFMNIGALETAVALSPEAHFRIFRLAQWIDGVESWLGSDGRSLWRSLIDPWEMELGAPTWVGIDVALKRDSTAIVWAQARGDRWHVKAKIWEPTEDGHLDVTDAMHWLRQLGSAYDVRSMAYDPRFFDLPAQQLMDEGYPMVEFPQSLERMTPAVGQCFEKIKRGELSHDGDELFEHQVLNAVAKFNERGFTLSKAKSGKKGRIDAAVSMCIALSQANQPQTNVALINLADL